VFNEASEFVAIVVRFWHIKLFPLTDVFKRHKVPPRFETVLAPLTANGSKSMWLENSPLNSLQRIEENAWRFSVRMNQTRS
jgi:hypothetical protein